VLLSLPIVSLVFAPIDPALHPCPVLIIL
jgi:hypothetical protein